MGTVEYGQAISPDKAYARATPFLDDAAKGQKYAFNILPGYAGADFIRKKRPQNFAMPVIHKKALACPDRAFGWSRRKPAIWRRGSTSPDPEAVSA